MSIQAMREEKRLAAATRGAIGISAIASFIGLCCIGPCAVALFGVPGVIEFGVFREVGPFRLPHEVRNFDGEVLLTSDRLERIRVNTDTDDVLAAKGAGSP